MTQSLFEPGELPLVVHPGGQDATSNEWYTPRWLLDWLPEVLLDPCWAPGSSVGARHTVDVRDGRDGLQLHWADLVDPQAQGVVWCNPPYGDCANWVRKCRNEARYLRQPVVALVPAYAGDQYWHREVWRQACFVGFVAGRIRFDLAGGVPAKDSASFTSALVIWASQPEAAQRVLVSMAYRAGRKVLWVDAAGLGLP